MKTKAFYTANVRDIMDQWHREEITHSRMVELLNEEADKFYMPTVEVTESELLLNWANWIDRRIPVFPKDSKYRSFIYTAMLGFRDQSKQA